MKSPNFRKLNPKLEVNFEFSLVPIEPYAEIFFIDGTSYKENIESISAQRIRSEMFERAQYIENVYDVEDKPLPFISNEDDTDAPKKGSAAPKKK